MWFALALSSAVIYAFRGVLEKLIVARVDRYILGLAIRLFALPFFFIPFIIKPDLIIPLNELSLEFWLAACAGAFICTPLETYFYYKSIKDEEITLALPILSLAPALTIMFSVVILREWPTIMGALGVLTILFGVYSLKIGHARHGLLEPLYHLTRNKSVRLMAIVAVSVAISSIFDKIAVTASSAYVYALVVYILVTFSLSCFALLNARVHMGQLVTHAKDFSIIGLVVGAYTLLFYLALDSGNASYVVAIRSTSLLISIAIGVLWLKEKNFKTKIFAGSVIVLGLIFIKVLG